ncbi:MAG: helix-turn-helix domain-containing protein [Puniceicoccales bacterium]
MACELLTFTDLPVQEIAARVGLENPYYFSRLFKKRLGKSPSDYRKEKRTS